MALASQDVVTPANKKGIFGWMLFDWAAQPFFTVVTTFIFGPYFASRMVSDPDLGLQYWGTIGFVSSIIIAVLSPLLGAMADATGSRKSWIAVFALVKIISLSLLWYAAPGSSALLVGMLFVLASLAAEFSIVFNDSMMTRLVGMQSVGRISNIAWGLGYLGGMIALFAVLLLMAGNAETGKTLIGIDPIFGLDPAKGEDARITGPLSALWYLIFILPMFLFTPDTARGMPLKRAVRSSFSDLRNTLGEISGRPGIVRFLLARMFYQDGVNGLLFLGGAFAAGMFSWQTMELGLYGIILNVVAIFGCVAASFIDSAIGSKKVVFISLVLLLLATVGIVSTGPEATFFGAIALPAGDSGRPFRHHGREGLYPLWHDDRRRIRPDPGIVPVLSGPQRQR